MDLEKTRKDYDIDTYNTLQTSSLLDQLNSLRAENNVLRAQNQAVMMEKQKIERTLDEFKNIPAIVGIVSEIYDDRAIVRGYNGLVFYIRIPEKFLSKIKVDDRLALAQNNLAILDILPTDKDYRATALELIEKPNIDLKSVGGLEDVILEIEETVSLPLTNPKKFEQFGIDSPKGVLLYGPPGTGKTLLAKAIATKSQATFISLSGSELIHKFIGEGAKIVKDLFSLAREKAPAIIFIDEIDAVAAYRLDSQNGADREVNRTMMQLLVEMDGFKKNDKVKIIGATNRIDILDEAILRPGRFDRIIKVPLPNEKSRKQIFKIHLEKLPIDINVKIQTLVNDTNGFSGAQIEAVCREAAIFAIRNKQKTITQRNFTDSIEKIKIKQEEAEINGRMFN